jgi:hypothetical protein
LDSSSTSPLECSQSESYHHHLESVDLRTDQCFLSFCFRINIKHAIIPIVKAWDDNNMDPRQVAEEAWEGIFHPDFARGNSAVQQEVSPLVHPITVLSRL